MHVPNQISDVVHVIWYADCRYHRYSVTQMPLGREESCSDFEVECETKLSGGAVKFNLRDVSVVGYLAHTAIWYSRHISISRNFRVSLSAVQEKARASRSPSIETLYQVYIHYTVYRVRLSSDDRSPLIFASHQSSRNGLKSQVPVSW